MRPAVENDQCRLVSHHNCLECRTNPAWRQSVIAPDICPHGVTAASFSTGGVGSIIEKLVKPIAKALKLSCLEKDGNLRPTSPCAKRRQILN